MQLLPQLQLVIAVCFFERFPAVSDSNSHDLVVPFPPVMPEAQRQNESMSHTFVAAHNVMRFDLARANVADQCADYTAEFPHFQEGRLLRNSREFG